jgi:hypothetical protein
MHLDPAGALERFCYDYCLVNNATVALSLPAGVNLPLRHGICGIHAGRIQELHGDENK